MANVKVFSHLHGVEILVFPSIQGVVFCFAVSEVAIVLLRQLQWLNQSPCFVHKGREKSTRVWACLRAVEGTWSHTGLFVNVSDSLLFLAQRKVSSTQNEHTLSTKVEVD
jgi:hypothetical protein